MTTRLRLALAAGGLLLLTACGGPKALKDAPVGVVHSAPREVWAELDEFMNVSPYCIGPNGVYTHTREAPPVIIKDDANCAEGGLLYNTRTDVP